MRISETEDSRVAILGAGREGQAVWRQLRRRFPRKPLHLFSESAIDETFRQQIDPVIDVLRVGPLDVTVLRQFDLLVRSAGISIYRQELRKLRSLGVQFTSASSLWFAENPTAKTICITGTLGKSTTATLIAQLLTQAGLRTVIAGNIGRPMLDCDQEDTDWWVIELSSYQLADLEAGPDIVVLLNISEDHLDWHRGIENYRTDKLRLAQLVSNGKIIANFSDETLRKSFKNHPDIIWFNRSGNWQAGGNSVFCQRDESGQHSMTRRHVAAPASLPGEHNMQNLAAALTVVETLGLDIPRLDEVLSSFSGLPHRLQFIGERNGIRYVNDSISTTPVSVRAALQTIGSQGVVLLLGGMDRGLDWSGFAGSMSDSTPHAIITLPDNGQRIFECLTGEGVEPEGGLHTAAGLGDAVALAEKLVPERGCILLSPGAPSFPHFRDFADRGKQFKKYSGL
jgi:UDP-N-acetylmuramoylalanine--D-glutamate ligase